MKIRTAFTRGTLAALAVLFIAGAAVAANVPAWHARLSGDEETPPVEIRSKGQATFKAVTDDFGNVTAIDYKVRVNALENLSGGHIHLGPAGTAGPVIVNLNPTTGTGTAKGVVAEGTFDAGDLTGPLTGMQLTDLMRVIAADSAYVNLHTTEHPGGAIRGQISARGGN